MVDRVDRAAVWTKQVAAGWEIIGRIGEDHVDRCGRQRTHHRDAIALQDAVERQVRGVDLGRPSLRRRRLDPFHHTHASPRSRSEEHTSELQSLMRISYAVFCLKKKKNN